LQIIAEELKQSRAGNRGFRSKSLLTVDKQSMKKAFLQKDEMNLLSLMAAL
jgi:hypothetical protein